MVLYQLIKLGEQLLLEFVKLIGCGAVIITVHLFHRIPPHRSFPVVAVILNIARSSRIQMPMQARITLSKALIIHLLCTECVFYSLCNQYHLLHEFCRKILVKIEKLSLVLLAKEQSIALKMLVVADNHIARFKLLDEVRISAVFYHFNSVAY